MANEIVYDFLKNHVRPYNVNDVIGNLPKEIGKSAVQKALDYLVKKEKIFEKTYGKQKIYCFKQDNKKDAYELMRIDRELESHAQELTNRLQHLEKEVKCREEVLEKLKSTPSLKEVTRLRDECKVRTEALEKKLQDLTELNKGQDLSQNKINADKLLDKYSRDCAKRKRLCTDILDAIMEGYPGTKKELYNDIGIEIKK
ncbi:hypothetical protein PV325_007590 [Microctonus aethiopoides]|uniref:Homologous-pairing protein 2 winged helix domain-containing protein n=1 Tax=Microctonus aethiopoides TaxID=144406 RepID=A0AA39FYT2_9HYME|nr:hypothetical protein PV325_007590 [Microctonus aethiopoides]KAK0092856.1 hypothetical protein PV326_000451 [Microctonus aethiopoides]KAK0178168.1 hypothetical protein PV328_002143 [Microctonus aethiopoides]